MPRRDERLDGDLAECRYRIAEGLPIVTLAEKSQGDIAVVNCDDTRKCHLHRFLAPDVRIC